MGKLQTSQHCPAFLLTALHAHHNRVEWRYSVASRGFSGSISVHFKQSSNPCKYFQNVSLIFRCRKLQVPSNPLTPSFVLQDLTRHFKTALPKLVSFEIKVSLARFVLSFNQMKPGHYRHATLLSTFWCHCCCCKRHLSAGFSPGRLCLIHSQAWWTNKVSVLQMQVVWRLWCVETLVFLVPLLARRSDGWMLLTHDGPDFQQSWTPALDRTSLWHHFPTQRSL